VSHVADFLAETDRHGHPLFKDARVIGMRGPWAVVAYQSSDRRSVERWALIHEVTGLVRQDGFFDYEVGRVVDMATAGRVVLGLPA
jgi:hypothetical protein